MRKTTWVWLLGIAFLPFAVNAQPPEELPPEEEQVEEVSEPAQPETVAPAPQAAPAPAPVQAAPAPVAEPLTSSPPPEGTTYKGVTLSPTLGIYPIGYDSVNLSGTGEAGRYFAILQPGFGLSTKFKTAGDHTIDFSGSYTLIYREYFNKEITSRDFEHDLDVGFGIDWTDRFNTDMYGLFVYFYKMGGTDPEWDNAWALETDAPRLTFKVLPNLSLKAGLWNQYVCMLDRRLTYDQVNAISNPPGDLDDLRSGDLTTDSLGFSAYDPSLPSYAVSPYSDTQRWFVDAMALRLATSYEPVKGTRMGFDYRYAFAVFSNDDNQEWMGHYLKPSISQQLPWKGGSLSLTDELRLRKYDFRMVANNTAPRENFRNRLTVSIEQAVTNYLSLTAFYRFQLIGENEDDYSKLLNGHWFYTGMNFSF